MIFLTPSNLTKASRTVPRKRNHSAFTLAEVLAALAFMAVVIPVAVQGLRVANTAGQVGLRKVTAARIAERVLNEWIVMGQQQTGNQRGVVQDGVLEYRWNIRTELWNQDTMRLATAQVQFTVQGRELEVHLSTLIDTSTQ